MAAAENPELIRQDVERTREELGATAEALAYKADAPARAKDSIVEAKDKVTGMVSGATGSVRERTPDGRTIKRRAGRMRDTAQHNPGGLLIGSIALGFLVGTLMPTTEAEEKVVAPVADQVGSLAHEVKEAAGQAASQVTEAAKSGEPAGTGSA